MSNPLTAFAGVRCFVFDIDGVLTGGQVLVAESGELLRSVSIKDGYALKTAVDRGYHVAIITGGNQKGMLQRFTRLGITDYYSGVREKGEVFEAYCKKKGIGHEAVLYMGDDIPDLAPLRKAGLACAPKDACPEVLAEADFVSPLVGGQGCVRDVIERVLKLNDDWLIS